MLEHFQLAAIVKRRTATELLRIPLHRNLQSTLSETWSEQFARFANGVSEIEFEAGYTAGINERFRISNFTLPEWLKGVDTESASALDSIGSDQNEFRSVTGMVAHSRVEGGRELVLFQNFTRTQVIKPGWFLLLGSDTYKSNEKPGLTLKNNLSAVYDKVACKLLFKNFRTTNTFLPLADYFAEASDQEIKEILDHATFELEDLDIRHSEFNQWFRTRFSILRHSKVLDDYSADEIHARSLGFDVNVRVSNGKVVFPTNRSEAKRLMQFLCEEIYRGPITETIYETNSKRRTD